MSDEQVKNLKPGDSVRVYDGKLAAETCLLSAGTVQASFMGGMGVGMP